MIRKGNGKRKISIFNIEKVHRQYFVHRLKKICSDSYDLLFLTFPKILNVLKLQTSKQVTFEVPAGRYSKIHTKNLTEKKIIGEL